MITHYQFNDTTLEYEILGHGTPILFLHGWGMDRHLMSGCFEAIFENLDTNFQRIYIDLPGMGNSTAGAEIKTSDNILSCLISFAKNVIKEPFILAGESYGGYLARGLVRQYPEYLKALILLCPLMVPGYRQGSVEPHIILQKEEIFLNTLSKEQFDSFSFLNVILTENVWNRYKTDIMPALENQNTHFLNKVLDGSFSFAVDELEAPFTKPCLILVGKQDTEVGYKDQFGLTKLYPNATYCAINQAGHNLQIEQPLFFQSIVSCWLSSIQ